MPKENKTLFTLATKDNLTICSVRKSGRFFSRSYVVSRFSISRVEKMLFISAWKDSTFGIIKRYEA